MKKNKEVIIYMKGYAVLEKGKHGWVNVEDPIAGPLDAIVKPIALAPCSSDIHYMNTFDEGKKPVVLGHEAIGEVVEVGSLVKNFKPGDKVAVSPSTPDWCNIGTQTKGNNAHGERLMGGFKFVGERHGVFAEFFSVNNADGNMVHLPAEVSEEAALMAVDMMNTGFYGAELANIQYGDSVVVIGIGPVGIMAIAAAKLRGAGMIYGVGTRPCCVKLAKEYGASKVINYKAGDIADQIMEIEAKKVDCVIIAGGGTSSLNHALRMTAPNGTIANIEYMDKSDKFNFPSSIWGLGMSDVKIVGGFCPGGGYRLVKLMKLIQAKRMDPSKLINYRYEGFKKIPDALMVMNDKPYDLVKPGVFIKW